MSGIGLCGTSGTGKTTLAQAVSDRTGVPFIKGQVRQVYELYGITPEKHTSFSRKMIAQWKILEFAEAQYQAADSLFITDRTPMCYAAYVISEAMMDNLDDIQTAETMDYVKECYRIANLYFSSLILIQPGIAVVQEKGRPTNQAYLQHINLIITGMIGDPNNKLLCAKHFMKSSVLNLNKRVDTVIKIAQLVENLNVKQRFAATTH